MSDHTSYYYAGVFSRRHALAGDGTKEPDKAGFEIPLAPGCLGTLRDQRRHAGRFTNLPLSNKGRWANWVGSKHYKTQKKLVFAQRLND
jgi:hypothetical protein